MCFWTCVQYGIVFLCYPIGHTPPHGSFDRRPLHDFAPTQKRTCHENFRSRIPATLTNQYLHPQTTLEHFFLDLINKPLIFILSQIILHLNHGRKKYYRQNFSRTTSCHVNFPPPQRVFSSSADVLG